MKVESVFKDYGERPVLRGITFQVEWGECVVLMGPNGSGKTTLLKVLSTQARPDRGGVWVAGFSRRRQADRVRRSVGVVSHRPLLYEDLTVWENLTFFGRLYGVPGLASRARELLRLVGLEAHGDDRVRTLSHGMQKRLALARALLHDPPVLLLDEPESGLDHAGVEVLLAVVRRWREMDRAVIMATHNPETALTAGDRVLMLGRGRVVQEVLTAEVSLGDLRGIYNRSAGATA